MIVTREAHSPERFTVRQLPAAVQLSAATHDDAMRVARGYARTHALDVWYSDGGGVRRLEMYRSGGAGGLAHAAGAAIP